MSTGLCSRCCGAKASTGLDRVDVVQPALFAVMVSLAALWRSLGVEPDAVVGHSQGEVAAAFVAGALSLEDAAKVVALRSRALTRVAGKGAMAAVELGVEALRSASRPLGRPALPSPPSTARTRRWSRAIPRPSTPCSASWRQAQVFARKIRVDYASHCAQVEAVRDELLGDLATLAPRPGGLPLYSTVTGGVIEGGALDADYWYQNLRQPVRFAEVTETLLGEGHRFFVEVSPHPVLTLAVQETVERSPLEPAVVGSLRREEGSLARLLLSLAELHSRGLAFDWNAFFAPHAARRVALPTYAFQRERFWLEAPKRKEADVVSAGQASAEHPLLAAAVPLAGGEGHLFTGRLSLADYPWLADHAVFGTAILPGTAFLELALLAARHVGLDLVEELILEAPLALPAEGAVRVQMAVGPVDGSGRRPLTIYGRAQDAPEDGAWTRHAGGTLAPAAEPPSFDLRVWPPAGAVPVPAEGIYETLAGLGLAYGPAFQGLRGMWRQGGVLFAEARLPEAAAEEGFALHPALLDAALHALAFESSGAALPFSWTGVSLRAVGATTLRVRFERRDGDGAIGLAVADAAGEPVAWVGGLATRPVTAEQLQGALAASHNALFRLHWTSLPGASNSPTPANGVLLGSGDAALAFARYADLPALREALDQGAAPPEIVVVPFLAPASTEPADAHRAAAHALALLQAWTADERLASTRLILLTRRAIAAREGEDVLDLAHAPLWGLARSTQSEHPDLALILVDTDGSAASEQALLAALDTGERQIVLRDGQRLVPRLAVAGSNEVLAAPGAPSWRLHIPTKGSFEGLTFVAHPDAQAPLAEGQVRVAVRAAGLNFHDVLDSLGMLPRDDGPLGGEGAGIVTETGPGVHKFAVGDRVMGVFPAAFGPVAIADARMLVRMPAGWSFVQGASVPVVFLTAYHGLVDIGHLQAGQRVLIHAAAGGVGTAAVQIARHLGAEVFATASAGKWNSLRALGFDEAHLASSRDLDFEQHFLRATEGRGMDVVLDCLAREFVDASLRLLPRGGHFVEMGKIDIRDAAAVGASHPNVIYRAFDLLAVGPERIQEMLGELLALFERGVLRPPPLTCWDIGRAPQAFRALAQAHHIGKFVLTLAPPLDPAGTVLVTGGTGTLGARVARHLVEKHGVKHLLLTSRQGPAAAGAEALRGELEAAGAQVAIASCDAADRDALRTLLDGIPAAHPLTAVIHAAGALDDGVLGALTPERLDRVLAPKLDAAWHLHELTQGEDLAAFVLFSSVSGLLGSPGQANYAAANAALDALAHHRHAQGLAACSLAWGYWAEKSGMTAALSAADLARVRRAGLLPLTSDQGLALLDAALRRPEALLVPARFDLAALAQNPGALPALFRGLVRPRTTRAVAATAGATSLDQRLLSLPAAERERTLLDLVRAEAAAVLGLAAPAALEVNRPLQEYGLDSLMAVELRNRLATATGLRLAATLLFDHPTPCGAVAVFGGATISAALRAEHSSVAAPRLPVGEDEPIAIVSMSCRFPGGVRTPRTCGACWLRGGTPSPAFPTTADGVSTSLVQVSSAKAASFTTPTVSILPFSASAPARRWPSTRSSVCCSRSPGKRWSAPASIPPRSTEATAASSLVFSPTITSPNSQSPVGTI